MKRVTYIIRAGLMSAGLLAAAGQAYAAEPMNAAPQVQGTPSQAGPSGQAGQVGGSNTVPSAVQPGQAGVNPDQGKAAANPMNKNNNEAVDAEGKGTSDKRDAKKAEPENRDEAKEAGRDQNDKAQQGAETRKGDDKAAARDDKDQKSERSGSRASLDSGQRTKIQTYFRDHKPSGHRVERSAFSVSLGFAVPSTVILAPLPPDVIVVSAACPIQYFVWADDLVLVDSCSREVVDIIPGAA